MINNLFTYINKFTYLNRELFRLSEGVPITEDAVYVWVSHSPGRTCPGSSSWSNTAVVQMLRCLRESETTAEQCKCTDGSLEESVSLGSGRPSIGAGTVATLYSPGSSLLLTRLFFVTPITCRRQIFACSILAGQDNDKNLAPTKISLSTARPSAFSSRTTYSKHWCFSLYRIASAKLSYSSKFSCPPSATFRDRGEVTHIVF